MRIAYEEQLKYPFDSNWGNSTAELRNFYGIAESDREIVELSKESWKHRIKKKVSEHALSELKNDALCKKWSNDINFPLKLENQNYLCELPSKNARKIFHARAGTIDLRAHRTYMYGEQKQCRLCNGGEENVVHVVNECPSIPRQYQIDDVYNGDTAQLFEASKRLIRFDDLVEELFDATDEPLI